MAVAHGVLASIAFLALFPAGAVFIRIPKFGHFIWIHAGIQILAYCVFVAAAGLGVYMIVNSRGSTESHPIIGIVLLVVLFTQPFAGLLHHRLFKKEQRRTLISYEHVWVGRIAILLGILNGGFGLMLAGVTKMGHLAAYGVVAGVIGSAYVAGIVYSELMRRSQVPSTPPSGGRKHRDSETELQPVQRQ